jgi:uncharacterized lipoprotein YbaY
MVLKKGFLIIMLASTLVLAACGKSSNKAAITGVIAHSHRLALPVGFVVTIRIEDITKSNEPGKKIAEEVHKSQGEILPIPFAIVYDPGKINPEHSYSVHVEITDEAGTLLYCNITSVPVITQGNPTQNVKVTVVLPNE